MGHMNLPIILWYSNIFLLDTKLSLSNICSALMIVESKLLDNFFKQKPLKQCCQQCRDPLSPFFTVFHVENSLGGNNDFTIHIKKSMKLILAEWTTATKGH
jgi:hypothetical protein